MATRAICESMSAHNKVSPEKRRATGGGTAFKNLADAAIGHPKFFGTLLLPA
jgi:hypothetical protein